MRDYNAFSSDDLVNWRDEGIVFSFDSISWADYAWAQQVTKLPNGTFVMYSRVRARSLYLLARTRALAEAGALASAS